ncbi:MAG: hypothetical protein CL693_17585 [Cellvibrionaceae bacterium]|nr:hypothetical protein [Cellvibrionaceae bacterium]|tara:strand:- start:14449 stop:16236 length:1788 start_codon:yes stop_codon:yes gene_type:complete
MKSFLTFNGLFLLLCLYATANAQQEQPGINMDIIPVIDVSGWDQVSPIALEGSWYLDYRSHDDSQSYQGLVQVPSLWRKLGQYPRLSGLGVGNYRIKLVLPAETVNPLSLHLPSVSAAQNVRIFYEGKWHNKLIAASKEAANASFRHPLIALPEGVHSLIVEISINSNFSTNGGIERAPLVAPTDILNRQFTREKITIAAICAIIMTLAFGNFALWGARPKNASFLLLGVLAVIICTRIFVSDSDAVYDFFPTISVSQNTTIGWAIFLSAPLVAAFYFYLNYPKVVGRGLLISIVLVTAVATGHLLFTDIPTLQSYADIHRPLIALLTFYIVIRMVWGLVKGNRMILPSVISGTLVIVGFVVETLHFQAYGVVSPYMAFGLGWLAFLTIETLKISRQYRLSQNKIDRLEIQNETLNELAHIDPLTKLPNRRAFDDRCRNDYNTSLGNAPEGEPTPAFAVMLIDLDWFKQINDKYGHDAGDAVLIKVSQALRRSMRRDDFVARLGGEEFCLLHPNADIAHSKALARRVSAAIEHATTHYNNHKIKVTASIGIALFDQQPLRELIRQADQALYAAKSDGRNTTRCYWELESAESIAG